MFRASRAAGMERVTGVAGVMRVGHSREWSGWQCSENGQGDEDGQDCECG